MIKTRMWRSTTLLVAMALVTEVSVHDFDLKYKYRRPYISEREILLHEDPYITAVSDEYVRHVHSMLDAYRGDGEGESRGGGGGGGGRLVIETNALIDTKYRTWKRNADLINSLLALPKGMNDAGR